MPKPKIGLSMLYCLSEPFSEMTKRLAKVETRYIEVLDEGLHSLNKKRIATLKEAAASYGFTFSVHAPFADLNIASPSKPILTASIKRLKESMEYANALDAKLWVFHPGNKTGISVFYPDKDWKQNIESIIKLHETAEEYGLNIAMENLPEKYGFIMKQPEDFHRFYKETGLNDIGIVLDVGHANLEAQIEHFLRQLPDKIVHIHASDNMGENDQHLGIGNGKINWQQFAKILNEIAYNGAIVIESIDHVNESLQRLRQLLA
ncbi:MAG: sugar phosphate isomerase/epimerase [Candidatus Bathyarchaeota archaeon]|nr:sugar phosphate isomerase/epimerase [Candidatus Bathyarchaeota archaeon]